MEKLSLRIATEQDAEALLNLYSYYVKNTSITFEWEVPSVQEFSQRISNTLKKFPYIVACQPDGTIVGYAYVSPFKSRAAYDWAVESSIYVHKDYKKQGIGKNLLEKLEEILKQQNILNINACIAYPPVEDEYLTKDSVYFHQKMGYSMVGEFHQCGYKFDKWYNMVWMEKELGKHVSNQPKVIPFPEIKDKIIL